MFTYSGWNAAVYVAEEIHNPGRNVPRASPAYPPSWQSTPCSICSSSTCSRSTGARGRRQRARRHRRAAARRACRRHHGDVDHQYRREHQRHDLRRSARTTRWRGTACSSCAAARVHPRYQTPATSIVAQAVWAGLLVLSGSADALTTYTGFAVVLFASFAVTSLFVLRQREPDAARPSARGVSHRPCDSRWQPWPSS